MGEPTVADAMPYLEIDAATKMKEQAAPFDAKKMVWVPAPKGDLMAGYLAAEVQSTDGDSVEVKTMEGNNLMTVKKDDCAQMNPPKYEKCVDMANLTYLNEASVLHNLRARYQAGLIYTYSGLFCIAVNPYRRLPIYSDAVVKMYRGKRRPEVPPHIFAIVDSAYQDMLIDHENQSMLITGESGAGKTENTKKVIQYIAKVAGVEKKKDEEPAPGGGVKGDLDEQVVQANPLLEAFGNAKTTRNNNSSRFGKFIRCHFGNTGKLAGADIESYLLEKNRVIHQGSQERNYHIFYQILYAANDGDLAKYCLLSREAKDYGFLTKGVSHVDRIDDHEEYQMTLDAIKILGFTPEEHTSMFNITAAILNFSNMKFKQKPRDEQAEVEDPADGERVGYLLGIPVGEFHKSLIKPKVKVGTEYVNKGQSVDQVHHSVSALSKALFARMFSWIVTRVNKALDTKERRSYFIGVLDIAGFEIFDYNSFDQLCINLTNEKLQQFFNHHMFVLEQEEYKKEGILWDFIDFGMDLEQTIDLIEKPMGIFAMLEEECIVPKATDKTYLEKMHKQHAGKSKSYTKPTPKQSKAGGGDFILHHYAGDVGYSIEGWLEKNKDPINENTAQLFAKATDPLVNHLFQDYNPDKAGGRKKGSAFQTVSYRHKEQLKSLMDTLFATSPHFVRCIIPNEQKAPGVVEGPLVLHQLRCNGVLEGIRICRKGFPSRMLFADFKQRYQILAASAIPAGFIDGKVAATKLIEAMQLDESEYKIGNTKVFFRSGIVGELEEMRDERLSKIMSQFQAYCKAHLMRIEYKKMCDQRIGLAVIQRNVRKFLMLRNWPWWKLYIKVQPLLSIARAEDEMREKEEELKKAMENAEANEKRKKELEAQMTEVMAEKEKLFNELRTETDRLIETEDKLLSTQSEKAKLEASLNEALERLEGEEHGSAQLSEKFNKAKEDIKQLQQEGEEKKLNIQRLEGEKQAKDKQIAGLNEDIKAQEEAIAKLGKEKKAVEDSLAERTEQLQASEDKVRQLNTAKNKMEAQIKDTEHNLQKEKDARAKLDKEKRKVEGELKDTQGQLADKEVELRESQETVAKKMKAIKELEDVKEGNENLIKQLQKKIQELLARIEELESELENEQKLRQKGELARKDLESQLEELQEQLEEQGGATTAQVEVSKKREAECSRLRKEIEDVTQQADSAAAAAKAKFNQALSDAQEEAESIKKAKAKVDKEKGALSNELGEMASKLEQTQKQKSNADKANRALQDQLAELQNKLSETESSLADAENKASRASAEGGNTGRALEESEHKLGLATKNIKALEAALSEAKMNADEEAKGRHDANVKLQNALGDMDALNEQLEEESSAKAMLQQKLSKMSAELSNMKGKFDEEALGKVEELEDAKKKLAARVQDMEEALSAAESKAHTVEKAKQRMNDEVEDLLLDLEKAQVQAGNLEKKQKKVDQQINEWRGKCDEVQGELDKAQKDARGFSAELLKLRGSNEELEDRYNLLVKENKMMSEELRSVTEQLNDGGKNTVELEKIRRQLSGENEELTNALEEAEGALEQESAKLLKLQLEFAQLKQSSDRKMSEKEDEMENQRKNHQRQLETLQHTIDAELKGKGDLLKSRKQIEADLLDLEGQLESAHRNAGDAVKNSKKYQQQIKELQALLDEQERAREDMRDSINRAERRANDLAVQLDESKVSLEQTDRARKFAENERNDAADRLQELEALYNGAANAKRKAEGDFHSLQEEIEALENDVKNAEANAAKSMTEVARLMTELNGAHESRLNADKSRALLAKQVADLQGQLEAAEAAGGKNLKNQIRKLEQRILELESDLDTEGRKSSEIVKQARKAEKKVKEVEFALEDERKAGERTADAANKLNEKMKKMRLQLEDAEMQLTGLQSKYKKALIELEESEERSEAAEQALQKARQRTRGQTQASTRMVSSTTSRSVSRLRTPAHGD